LPGSGTTFADVQPVAPVFWAYETTSAISKTDYFEQLTENEGSWALGVQLFFSDLEQNRSAFS
jgi:hypothetical protein